MIYWVTQSITSSMRLYYETNHSPYLGINRPIKTPTGIIHFPYEILIGPRRWISMNLNVIRWTEVGHGGHFAALEEPDVLCSEIKEFSKDLHNYIMKVYQTYLDKTK